MGHVYLTGWQIGKQRFWYSAWSTVNTPQGKVVMIFGDPLLEWHLEISKLFSLGIWMVYYGPKMGLDWPSNTDSRTGASPLRGVRCVPLGGIQLLGLSPPKNDPLWEFPMQLWRIGFLVKIVFCFCNVRTSGKVWLFYTNAREVGREMRPEEWEVDEGVQNLGDSMGQDPENLNSRSWKG